MTGENNDFDIYFNQLNDYEINELGGFFKKIKKAVKKVSKVAKKAVKAVAPVAATMIPGIGPAVAPLLAAASKGGVGAVAVNLLKNTPMASSVVKSIGGFIGKDGMAAINEIKPEFIAAFNSTVSPQTQEKINKAITVLKMQGKDQQDILGQFLRSELFKGISTKINEKVVGATLQKELVKFNLPQPVIDAEIARKAPIVAVAATEKVAEQSKKPFSLKENLPYIGLGLALLKFL